MSGKTYRDSRSTRCGLSRLLVGLMLAVSAAPALAQSGSWDVDADGNWTTGANWLNGVAAAGNGNTATFANDITASRTVTLDAARAVGGIVFGDADPTTAASWIVAGGSTLTLNNLGSDASVTVNGLGTGATATISTPIGGNPSLSPTIVKDGSGTLVLTATSAFTSNLGITAGTLEVSADRNLGGQGSFATDRITISNGAALRTTAGFTMNANRGVTVGTGGGVLDINGGNLIYPSRLTGAGQTVTMLGASSLSLSNSTGTATDVNWDFSANSGTRVFFAGSDALGTGSVRIRDGMRLVSQNTAPTNGQVTNAVTLDDGAGLSARNSASAVEYTNVTFPSSGTIVLNKDDQLTAALTISSGATLTGALTIDTSQQAGNAVGDVILSGVLAGSGSLVKDGTGSSGTLILGGANTYAGDTTITTGTLALGASGSLGSSAAINVASGASFDVSAVSGFSLGSLQALNGAGSVVGDVTASGTISPGLAGGAGTLTFGNDLTLASGATLAYLLDGGDGTVGGGVNDLIELSAGNLTLDGIINVSETVPNSFLSATVGSTWRLINYSGSITDNGLTLGSMPTLTSGLAFELDTATPGQVNLVVAVPEPVSLMTGMIGLGFFLLVSARRGWSLDRS